MNRSEPPWSKRYRAPAPLAPFRFKIKGGQKVAATYDLTVRCWRVGVISDFYCGTRSDDDDTVIWLIDGIEYARDDVTGVRAQLERACTATGVEGIEWGPFWCGYRELIVRFSGGVVVSESYNGRERVETATRESAVA